MGSGQDTQHYTMFYLPMRKRSGQMRQMSPPADITSPPATPRKLPPPLYFSTTNANESTGAAFKPAARMDGAESGIHR